MLSSAAQLNPSRFLKRLSEKIRSASTAGGCILDIPCGTGRNALYLAEQGMHVHCIDNSLNALSKLKGFAKELSLDHRLTVQQLDLLMNVGSIEQKLFFGIINIDWPQQELLPHFENLLQPEGFLVVETFGDRGENWRCLPKANFYKEQLSPKFLIHYYDEHKAGPVDVDAVTVKLFATKKAKENSA